MSVERKLDIFRVLDAVSTKDVTFFDKLSEEEIKAFVPFVVTRWMSGTSNARQVFFINELINPFVFSLQGHKQLLWYLMTICGSGKPQRYVWNALPNKKNSSKPNAVDVIKAYYGYSTTDAVEVLSMLTRANLIDMAGELGWQPDEIAKIKREVKEDKEPPSLSPSTLEF